MGVIVIFPLAATLAVLGKRRFEETVFPAIGLVVFTFVFTGMAGSLKAGMYIVPVFVLASIIMLIIKHSDIRKYVLTPGFLAFIICILFFLIFSYGRCLISETAISHYGLSLRNIFATGSLKDSCPYYELNWPLPLVSVWAYFCSLPKGDFSEWQCIFAYDVFIISTVFPLFSYVRSIKAESKQWLCMLLLCILLPVLKMPEAYSSFDMAVPQGVSIVYVFVMLHRMVSEERSSVSKWWCAGLAAIGLVMACTLTEYAVFALIPLFMGMVALAGLNASVRSYVLAAMGAGVLLSTLLSVYGCISSGISVNHAYTIPECCLACVFLAMVITMVMRLYEKGHKMMVMFVLLFIVAGIAAISVVVLKNSPNSEYLTDWLMEYTDKLFIGRKEEADYIMGRHVIPIYDATFLFIVMGIYGLACGRIAKKYPDKAASVHAVNVSFVLGTAIYLAVLGVMYINVIRQPHSVQKPVIAAYIAPVIVWSFVAVFMQSLRAWKKEVVLAVGTIVLIACVFTDPVGAVFNKPEREDPYPLIASCRAEGMLTLTEADRVFYVDKELTDEMPAEFAWAVFPAGADAINGLYFNPEPYRWVDYISEPLTAIDFADMLREGHYTYIYLKNVDETFTDMYYPVFPEAGADIRNDAIYRVEYTDRGAQIIFIAGAAQEDDAGEEQ